MEKTTVLDRIVESKARRLADAKAALPLEEQKRLAAEATAPRGFLDAIARGCAHCGGPSVIAEIKKASPSAGIIHAELDEATVARGYAAAGASALSVLTEEDHFSGMLRDLATVRDATTLPVLRKDFLTDPYQLYEARAAGADAVLLIVAILGDDQLAEMLSLAPAIGLDALVEVHDEAELATALDVGARIVGVNSRDLKTLEVDLATAERLLPAIPDGTVRVAESGIRTRADLDRMTAAGADAVLVGEALLRADEPANALAELTGHKLLPPLDGEVVT